jgi:uncharacterized linocin/CFP29 family protein
MVGNNNNLKRNEVGSWAETDIWKKIDQSVYDEVKRIRVAASVFIPRPMPNEISVSGDEVDINTLTLNENTLPFVEISQSFSLTDNQIEKEAVLGTAVILARMAAKSVAMAEEIILFGGRESPVPLPPGINIQRLESARQGLLGLAAETRQVVRPAGNPPGVFGEANFDAVSDGINRLVARGQPGPYALFLSPPRYADSHRSLTPTLVTAADRMKPLLPGGFHATVGLPANRGLLVSLGGEATSLVVSQDTITGFTQQDDHLSRFRVFERIQFVVRDPRALLRLEFQEIDPVVEPD